MNNQKKVKPPLNNITKPSSYLQDYGLLEVWSEEAKMMKKILKISVVHGREWLKLNSPIPISVMITIGVLMNKNGLTGVTKWKAISPEMNKFSPKFL
jgi:hypothetical protein